ncbi:MAG: 50S ribosomal protein L2 [Candidatus Odinarchaeota archaeon]|nr:50S ribosomal protein L2 [Candidatus Odinarchaeota archaeon]
MGKRILVQRRGRGGSNFRAPSHKRLGSAKYPSYNLIEKTSVLRGTIVDLLHDPGRGAPLAQILTENKQKFLIPAAEGVYKGQTIYIGSKAPISIGNILPLASIPEGTQVFNIEGNPGDGGKFVRSSGMYALLITHTPTTAIVQLPSGKQKAFPSTCRATIGVVSGGGRTEKPFVKAGAKYYLSKVRSFKWPKVRGVAMNPVSHPHGGGSHQSPGKPTTVSRNAPPGAKVGLIAARRAGKRK